MDSYTLIVWFMIGSNVEVVRTEGLTQAQCVAELEEVLARRNVSATCRGISGGLPTLRRCAPVCKT